MYRYTQVEAALAAMHDTNSQTMGAFRGRLKNFQKLGLVPSSPGKGRKIQYTFADAARWAFCLELTEMGIDPTTLRDAYHHSRDYILRIMEADDDPEDSVIFFNLSWQRSFGTGIGLVEAQVCKLSEATFVRMSSGWKHKLPRDKLKRVVAVNLTRLARELRNELAAAVLGHRSDMSRIADIFQ